jgi:hypothetical protein
MTSFNSTFKTSAVFAVLAAAGLATSAAMADDTPATRAAGTPAATHAVHRQLPDGISPAEAARLRNQIKELKQAKRAANADGEITRAEQLRLQHKAQQIRRMIKVAKNN